MSPTPPRPRVPLVRRLLPALALVATFALAAAGCADPDGGGGSGDGTLRVGVIGSRAKLSGPIGYLHARDGLLPQLEPLGFTGVEVFSFPNGPDLNQALAGGSLDVATYGDTPAMVGRGAGLRTRLVAVAAVDLDASVVVREDGPRTLRELEGERVSVQTGSYIHRYLLGALQDAEVEPKEVVHVYTADTEGPLARGDIAAAAMPQVNAEVFRSKGYRIIDHLAEDHPGYAGTSATVATTAFLSAHPDFTATWQRVQNRAVRQATADWPGYQDFAAGLSDFPAALVKRTVLREQLPRSPFPARGLTLLRGTKRFLLEEDFIDRDFPLDGWIVGGR